MTKVSDIFTEPLISWPAYEPPYDSPIEGIFAYNIVKYLPPDAALEQQVEVSTQCGTYRIDFLCNSGGRKVGFECDGHGYHEPNRDEWRDALIMAAGKVNAIYRITGRNIHWQIDRALYLIGFCERDLFSERGKTNLRILCEADSVNVHRFEGASFLDYRWYPEQLAHFLDDQDSIEQASRNVTLRINKSTDRSFSGREPEWCRKARFARRHRGKSLSEIMQLYPY